MDHSYTDYANVDEDDLRLMKEAGDTKGGIAQSKLLLLRASSSLRERQLCIALSWQGTFLDG